MKISDLKGLRVFVYRNLHRHCLSVRFLNRVIAWVDSIVLKDCTFKVSQAGRDRVIRERRKNIHAGVVGVIQGVRAKGLFVRVIYNPYKYRTFIIEKTGDPILKAKKCLVTIRGVFIK
jgi:hypothetical protein